MPIDTILKTINLFNVRDKDTPFWKRAAVSIFARVLTDKKEGFVINYPDMEGFRRPHLVVGGCYISKHLKEGDQVWGSGIWEMADHADPKVEYNMVRGPLSQLRVRECGGYAPDTYGDPLLLTSQFTKTPNPLTHHIYFIPKPRTTSRFREQIELMRRKYPEVMHLHYKTPADAAVAVLNSAHVVITDSAEVAAMAHSFGTPVSPVCFQKTEGYAPFYDYLLGFHSGEVHVPFHEDVNSMLASRPWDMNVYRRTISQADVRDILDTFPL